MKRLFMVMVFLCTLLLSGTVIIGQDVFVGDTLEQPIDGGGDLPPVDWDEELPVDGDREPLGEDDCREIENSCTVEYLQSVLCTYRSYLCIGDGLEKVFSWGLMATIHTTELSNFNVIHPETIQSSGDTNEQVDYINHEVLEYMICTLEGDTLCHNINNSFYHIELPPARECVDNPRAC